MYYIDLWTSGDAALPFSLHGLFVGGYGCTQGGGTKQYSIFNTGKIFQQVKFMREYHGVWHTEYYHKINCKPIGKEIQGRTNEYEQ